MKFCFFGNVSGALKGQTCGGGELQISLLARALALNGQEVVIVDPCSSESFITKEGIKLINIPNWNSGLKGIRLFLYRIPQLKKILAEEKADYYYVRMRTYLHLVIYFVARKLNAKFIIATACDLDVLRFSQKFKYEYKPKFDFFKFFSLYILNDMVFKYLLYKADYIMLQHLGQRINLNSARGKVIIFPNIFDFSNIKSGNNSSGNYFIVVGSLNSLKGIYNLKHLISILDKNTIIEIVGQPTDKGSKKVYEELRKFENVILTGRLNHSDTISHIANAKALINTSNFEGFPNIFLEAWATGVPVISLKINPDNIINHYKLGICCNCNLNRMKKCIESWETNEMDKAIMKSYVAKHHDINNAGRRFLNLIR